jgi:hypothetical protein
METTIPIIYPEFVVWKKDLRGISDVSQIFSKSTLKKILSTVFKLKTTEYNFELLELTPQLLTKFNELYVEHISKKKNPQFFDISAELAKKGKTHQLKIITLRQNGRILGGLIFSQSEGKLSSCYKYFPHTIELKLPTSVTYVAEYLFFNHAIMTHCKFLYHGRDRNCYGKFSQIGLARFKLQLGLQPVASKSTESRFFTDFSWNGVSEVLIFEGEEKGGNITNAKLLAYNNSTLVAHTYESILKNRLVHTTIIAP